MRVVLPWPPKELSPNARVHWAVLAKVKKTYREVCRVQAIMQGVKKVQAQGMHVNLTFQAPTRRAFDLDNALARTKAGLDGLADALGVDDKHWTLTIAKSDQIGGMVVVEISPK